MNMKIKNKKLILFLFITIYSVFLIDPILSAIDNETEKIMPFVKDNSFCQECHSTEELETKYKDLTNPCNTYCLTCHKQMEAHHKVDVEIDFKPPKNLFLKNQNTLTCTTCHDLKNKRFDQKPWKALSLFGKIFKRKTTYKTYYLFKNNSKGQLCKECH